MIRRKGWFRGFLSNARVKLLEAPYDVPESVMTDVTCPPVKELSSLLLGQLPTTQAEELEQHVETCIQCQSTVKSLHIKGDWLVEGLRAAGGGEVNLEPGCQEAMSRICSYAPIAVGPAEASLLKPPQNTVPPPNGASGLEATTEGLGTIREYRLLSKLGQGGMGAVYRAQHTKLRRTVAIKVLPAGVANQSAVIARFEREMQAVGALDHPNIVRAFDAGESDGRHYLVMEYVKGRDLMQVIRDCGPLPIPEACELIYQAAVGLQHAHDAGLVHRDIKPSNLILAETGVVKILDLGLALLNNADSNGDLTSAGQVMGTFDYMAPEQGGDTHHVDVRADIYSLGATLYKLLTGVAPFGDPLFDTPVKKLTALAMQEPTPVQKRRAEISQPLAAVVAKMMAKDPAKRYATAMELATALAPFTRGGNLAQFAATTARDSVSPASGAADTKPSLKSASADTFTLTPVVPNRGGLWCRLGRLPPVVRWLVPSAAAVALAGIVVLLQNQHGTVQVVFNDPTISVRFDQDGATIDGADPKPIKLKLGKQGIVIKRGDFEFLTTSFKLEKKGVTTLDIQLIEDKVQVSYDGNPLDSKIIPQLAAASKVAPTAANAPFDAARARDYQDAWARHLGVPSEYTNSIGMKFRLIPPGEFTMGSTESEIAEALNFVHRNDKWWRAYIQSETPQHKVILSKPVFIGVHEVTQRQYETLMGKNPSFFSRTGKDQKFVEKISGASTVDHPVEGVSWNDVVALFAKLNERESPATGYRLPTEAEWEFACRAGSSGNYWTGDVDTDLLQAAWFRANSGSRTHVVVALTPNPWGLYDTHGNVWEWVQDAWQPKFYKECSARPAVDPSCTTSVDGKRVLRGGDWSYVASTCRSSARRAELATVRNAYIGVRLALTVEAVKASLKRQHGVAAGEVQVADSSPAASTLDASMAKMPAAVFSGEWRTEDGSVYLVGKQPHLLQFGDRAWTDYDFRVRVTLDSKEPREFGLYARAAGDNWWMFILGGFKNMANRDVLAFVKGENAWHAPSRRFRANRQVLEPGRDYVIEVRVRGPVITAYSADEEIASSIHSGLLAGRVGLYSYGNVRFSELEVRDPSGNLLWQGLPKLPP